ncbi:RNA polymerase factor sigma-54 [Rhodovulum euryhalinum]|uniref:RNA polymerase sigma-54 factor n=1 Tax=Rhodovulum euryhalinum TaxID=35805 RepID=A0A4R2KHI1_9RHOB|nr:hypothetical protein [Rhodovulum euryhalinum]TCO69936.1 RNA polymerase RpoN-/SigL-like sigma 54 subunit [Rhodovulum euryhalinum]
MNFRPSLTPRPAQGLRLTPGLRSGLAILRMPAADLAAELREAAAENPLIRLSEPTPDRGAGGVALAELLAAPETLGERLRRQIALMPLDPAVAAIARFLTGDVDDDGYLDPQAAGNVEAMGAAPGQVESAIAALQACEPAGVGARSLEECLALQLREHGFPEAEARAACARLDLLAGQRLGELAALIGLAEARLRPMAEMLPRLTPRPGDSLSDETLPPVPEVIVEQGPDGVFFAVLDPHALPRAELDAALAHGLGRRPDAARMRENALGWIRTLRFRARTLEAVVRQIVADQQGFFARGPDHLVPMTRAAMACALDLHPSTVGRALAGKALVFRGAVHPLSLFVSPALPATGEDAVTAYAVQRRIRKLVEAEAPGRILSDERIAEHLRREGVDIARRTVAKYRQCLTIPSSFERRRRKAGQRD